MTGEEALRLIQIELECVRRQECEHNCETCDLAQDEEDILAMYSVAKEAIEKQTPQKVNDVWCPSCGHLVHFEQDYGCDIKEDFCDNCGQALLWEEEE